MTVIAAAPNGAPRARTPRLPPPFPTRTALALERATWHDLETTFQRGTMPDLDGLVGWEFRGINRLPLNDLPLATIVGIKKFAKGFFRAEDGRVMGYNCPVVQNVLDGRWHTKPSDALPKRFGFYAVYPVDATSCDNNYLHAILLDYGKGGNARLDPARGLRDYVVQVEPRNPDLLLGKAYYAIGPGRIGGLNFFILERWRKGAAELRSM